MEKKSSGPLEDMFGENFVKVFTDKTRRSVPQTEFLFKLVNYKLDVLVELEEKLMNNFCFYCPGTENKVAEVLKLGYGSYYWKMEFVLKTSKEELTLSFNELLKAVK